MLDQHTGPPDNVLPESDSAQFFLGVSVGGGIPGIGGSPNPLVCPPVGDSAMVYIVWVASLFMSCP